MATPQQIIDNIPQLALQEIMQHPIDAFDGSAVYHAAKSWHKAQVQLHPLVTVINDARALEAAMENPNAPILYIPHTAPITQDITRAILRRHSLPKSIIWELAHD